MSGNHYLKNRGSRITHLENYILESSDDEDSQEESYEDYILRNPNWILEKNINQDDLQEYEVSDDYIRGLFDGMGIAMDFIPPK